MSAASAPAGPRARRDGVALRAQAIAAEGLGVEAGDVMPVGGVLVQAALEENLAWLLARGVCISVRRSTARRSA